MVTKISLENVTKLKSESKCGEFFSIKKKTEFFFPEKMRKL